MDMTQRLREANDEAQARFRAMLDAGTYADPKSPEAAAYISAERLVDGLLADAQLTGQYPADTSYHDWQAVR